jgi:hypothetical protein
MKPSTAILIASLALGASALAQAANVAESASGGMALDATLSKSVDAGKAKAGDEVTATVNQDVKSNGQIIIKRGSKLVGHVTSARSLARASGGAATDSQLGIVFDRAVLKDGRQIPLSATIQALAAAQSAADAGADTGFSGGAVGGSAAGSGGGLIGGVAGGAGGALGGVGRSAGGVVHSGVGATAGVIDKSPGAVGGLTAAGTFVADSQGVFGMQDVALATGAAAGANESVLTSTTRTVRLDSGTQLLLSAHANTSAGAASPATVPGAVATSGGATAGASPK